MTNGGTFAADLLPLADRVAARVGNPAIAAEALKLVREQAPDERLALAFLLKLAEDSAQELRAALLDNATASELIATGLSAMGPRWLDFFRHAASADGKALMNGARCSLGDPADRRAVEAALGSFKRESFLRIAISDLVGR